MGRETMRSMVEGPYLPRIGPSTALHGVPLPIGFADREDEDIGDVVS